MSDRRRARARVVEPVPQEPNRQPAPRRSVMMTEMTRGLSALPTDEHNAFLADFDEKYPHYPAPRQRCTCIRCLCAVG